VVEAAAALSGAVVAVAAALVVLWKFVKLIRSAARKLDALDRVVQRELTPNGGGSMKDKSTATADAVAGLDTRLGGVDSRLGAVERDLADHLRLSALLIGGRLPLPNPHDEGRKH
jgi:uncharacterized membrane protein YccC